MQVEVLTSAASWHSDQPLVTYNVPEALQAEIRPGQLVAVPYSDRLVEGIIWHVLNGSTGDVFDDDESYAVHARTLQTILDPEPALLPHQMELANWISEYYLTPLSQ